MLCKEIRKYIQEPILKAAGWDDPYSKFMVYCTGHFETGYGYVMQEGTPQNGGIGPYQGQPSDYNDMGHWLKNSFNSELLERILNACNFKSFPSDPMYLAYNMAFATLVCRVHYHRIEKPLPTDLTDARAWAEYHKTYYNGGAEGKADVERNTIICQRIINNEI